VNVLLKQNLESFRESVVGWSGLDKVANLNFWKKMKSSKPKTNCAILNCEWQIKKVSHKDSLQP